MNNKGFAITGILYTLFIMFLLILVSVLVGLSARRNILQKSLLSLEESFSGTELSSDEINSVNSSFTASVDGKYEFQIQFVGDADTTSHTCVSYLKKGDSFQIDGTSHKSNIIFVPEDCNDYEISTISVTKIIRFESE